MQSFVLKLDIFFSNFTAYRGCDGISKEKEEEDEGGNGEVRSGKEGSEGFKLAHNDVKHVQRNTSFL